MEITNNLKEYLKKINNCFKIYMNRIILFCNLIYISLILKIIIYEKLWKYKQTITLRYSIYNLFIILTLLTLFYLMNSSINLKKIKKLCEISFTILALVFFIYSFKNYYEIMLFLNYIKYFYITYHVEIFIIFFILSMLELKQYLCRKNINKNTEPKVELYEEREKDLNLLEHLLNNNNIVGIDDYRGSGKSTIINHLLNKKKKEDNEIIKLNLLNLGKNEIINTLFNELDIILSRNSIFFKERKTFKKIFKEQSVLGIKLNPFMTLKTVSENISEFKNYLKSINKQIYIVIDDLDRTSDVEKIKNVLNIVSELSEGVQNLKFLILYSQKELNKLDPSLNRDYFEKFIPIFFKLSELSFENLMLKIIDEENLNVEDFDYLMAFYNEKPQLYKYEKYKGELNRGLNSFNDLFQKEFFLNQNYLTIRKVKSFLIEVKSYLKLIEKEQIPLEKRGIISYFYIKHFLYEEFEVLKNIKFHDILDKKFQIIFQENNKEFKLKDINIINYLLIKALDIESVNQVFFISRGEKVDVLQINKLYKRILETSEPLFEKKENLFHRIENVSKSRELLKNKINGFKLTEDIEKKLLIFFLFDYYFYEWNNLSQNLRHNENINHTIKKLNSWSLDDLSDINWVLNKLKEIFEIQEIEVRKEKYLAFKMEVFTNGKSIYYIGGNEWEEIMRELSRDEKIKYSKSIVELMFYSESSLNNNILKILSDENLYYNNKENWLFIMELFVAKEVKDKLYKPLAEDAIRKIIKFIIYNRYDVNLWKNDMILQDYYSGGTQKMIEEIKTNLTFHYPLEKIGSSLKEELKIIYNFLDKAKGILDNHFTVKKADTFKVEIKDGGLERSKEIEKLKRKENIDIDKLYSKGELRPNEYIELLKLQKRGT